MPDDALLDAIPVVQEGMINPNRVEARVMDWDIPADAVLAVRRVVNAPRVVPLMGVVNANQPVGIEIDWLAEPAQMLAREDVPTTSKKEPRKEGEPMKLCDSLGRYEAGLFGYELEVEGGNLPVRVDGWEGVKDGSLRGESMEYVLNTPSSLEEITKAFDVLVSKLTKPATKLSFSYRTSTHVHVNMLQFTKQQIQSFFYLAHLVEDVLVNYCAPIRKGNRFCLRTKDAEYKIDAFKTWLEKRGFPALFQDQLKYSAINIATLSQYGSIEFRSLHGTVDKDVVGSWLNVLKNIHDIASIVPIKEMEAIVKKSPMDILNVVFKEYLPKFHYTGMENDVIEAYERLIEIPYAKVVA